MKKIVFIILIGTFLTSCSNDEAQQVADEFHTKLDAGDYDYIMNNLVDLETTAPEDWTNFFDVIESWGPQENRINTSNYNFNTKNGITTVTLSYTFEIAEYGLMHERVIMINRTGTYKVLTVLMNTDESVVIEGVKNV